VQKRTAVIAAVAVLAVGGISGAVIHQIRAPRGQIPAASSPVSAVAATYLAAAKDHDCGLTHALTAKDGNTWAWCSNPRLLSYKHISRPYTVGKYSSPTPQKCVDFTMTTTGSSDGSMPKGEEPWGLCFVHTSDGWRLFDQGQG
jgi:hypothetical protein